MKTLIPATIVACVLLALGINAQAQTVHPIVIKRAKCVVLTSKKVGQTVYTPTMMIEVDTVTCDYYDGQPGTSNSLYLYLRAPGGTWNPKGLAADAACVNGKLSYRFLPQPYGGTKQIMLTNKSTATAGSATKSNIVSVPMCDRTRVYPLEKAL